MLYTVIGNEDPHIKLDTLLERIVNRLPERFLITFWRKVTPVQLEEYGTYAGNVYVVLECVSPEGYQTKFALFNKDLRLLPKVTGDEVGMLPE